MRAFNHSIIANLTGVLFGCFVLLPFNIKPVLVILTLVTGIIIFISNPEEKSIGLIKKNLKQFLIFSGFLLPLIFSLIYTENFNRGIALLFRLSPIVILPIGFLFFKSEQSRFIQSFNLSFCLSLIVYSVLIAFLFKKYTFSEGYEIFISHMIYEFWGFEEHPLYVTMYYMIGLGLILTEQKFPKYAKWILAVIYFATLLILMRKVFFLTALAFVTVWLLMHKKFKILLYTIGVITILTLSTIHIEFVKIRLMDIEYLFTDKKDYSKFESSSTLTREILWRTSENLLRESKYMGYGIGDASDVFTQRLSSYGFEKLSVENYNPHNQFLQFALMGGAWAAILYAFSLMYFFIRFFRSKNNFGVIVSLIMIVFSLVECILYRQNGIIVYALFMSVLIFRQKEIVKS